MLVRGTGGEDLEILADGVQFRHNGPIALHWLDKPCASLLQDMEEVKKLYCSPSSRIRILWDGLVMRDRQLVDSPDT